MKKSVILFSFVGTLMGCVFASCDKTEGEGGEGSVYGSVYKIVEDGAIQKIADGSYQFCNDTFPAREEKVYIVYGKNEYGVDDKTETAYNGTYKFNYLNDGSYKVYAYNDLASGEKVPVMKEAKISNGNSVKAEDIYIKDGKNNGLCGVVGVVQVQYKDFGWLAGVETRVYIKKVGDATITNDTRASDNGEYTFAKLEPNTQYYIFAADEPYKNEGLIAKGIEVTTGDNGSIVMVSDTLQIQKY